MYISWNWLKRHVNLDGLNPMELANRFTMSVAELEGIVEFGASYDKVVAARVLAVERHPDSDKLSVVQLDLGDRRVDAVSGAPGIAAGLTIAFALPGVVLEGLEGKPVVREVEIRGVKSPGMTCSERELGISDDHSGLMLLPEGTAAGTRLTDLLPVHDFIMEIDNKSITHRPDLWGHRGLAREVAALVKRPMLPFDHCVPASTEEPLRVEVHAPDLCPRYTALVFDKVTIGPSPQWLKVALSLVGIRPISNVVDITNFVMMDVGNPTHAFDARFVEEDAIIVRRANPGETLTTLDGVVRPLLPDDVVIADGKKGVALGGVMGGENSEIQDDTSRVVLEAACFNHIAIRRTSSRLGLRTEASARFEKGLDRLSPVQATALFARLLKELCPGSRVASRFYDVSAPEPDPTVVHVSTDFIRQKMGADISDEYMKTTLEALEFGVEQEGADLVIAVPTFRATRDIGIPEDIVEEIGRVYGYDNVTPEPIMAPVAPVPRVPARQLTSQVRRRMVAQGFTEILSYSFASASFAETIGLSLEGSVELANPISSDLPVLRRSLVPGLLQAVAKNSLHRDAFSLFEVGRTFEPALTDPDIPRRDRIPVQFRSLAAVVYRRKADNLELYRWLKGHVENLAEHLQRGAVSFETADHPGGHPWLVPGRTQAVLIDGRVCGYISLMNPVVRDRLKLRGKAALVELNLEPLISSPEQVTLFKPLPRFPGIQNDLSVIVDAQVTHQQVLEVIEEAGGPLLESTELFALFRGDPIPEGKKSLSFHLMFRSAQGTLADEQVEPVVEGILAALKQNLGGEIRT